MVSSHAPADPTTAAVSYEPHVGDVLAMVSNVAAMRLHVPEALRAHQELIRYGRACGLLPSVPDDMSDEDMVAVLSGACW